MYLNFFGLLEKPFNVTPDTHYLYLSSQHIDALRTLHYGVKDKKGFLMLTGEVGTGKTTTTRVLLNQLPKSINTSFILNPLISTFELVKTINQDFGIDEESDSIQEQINALNEFLLKNAHEGKNAVVIIDEAQNLSFEALEMTRLLSNLETENNKLLQIILVGQPELEEKLSQKELRQLAQRVQIYCRLDPLDLKETISYVEHRIHRAGNYPMIKFDKAALKEIYKISHGIPRRINLVCELALLRAYSKEVKLITKSLVKETKKEVPIYVNHS
jgi:general secretion pathway protein A